MDVSMTEYKRNKQEKQARIPFEQIKYDPSKIKERLKKKRAIVNNSLTVVSFALVIDAIVLLVWYFCFVNDENKWNGQMKIISFQCTWIGLVYIILAWFFGNGEIVTAGHDTYTHVVHWMQILSIGWIIVLVITLFSKLWNKNKNLSGKVLASAMLYFVMAYLIH